MNRKMRENVMIEDAVARAQTILHYIDHPPSPQPSIMMAPFSLATVRQLANDVLTLAAQLESRIHGKV